MVPAIELKSWGKSIAYALIFFCFFTWYVFVYFGSFTLVAVSLIFAATGAVLIGSSFALSGIGYYFNFLDKEVYERKYLGLLGYFFALTYTFMLPFVNPELYWYGIPKNLFSADYILGIGAMLILTMMAIISNKSMMLKVGPQRWRKLLRLGYVAYAMLIARAIVVEGRVWYVWFFELSMSLPPPRLLISIFAALVILLRISVGISKMIATPHPEQTAEQHR